MRLANSVRDSDAVYSLQSIQRILVRRRTDLVWNLAEDLDDPEALLAERRRKLQTARELRKQENIKLRYRLIPWVEHQTASYSGAVIISV